MRKSPPLPAVDTHFPEDCGFGEYERVVGRWERVTRDAPSPVFRNEKGKRLLNLEFAEWCMGLPSGHVTKAGLNRREQFAAIGNGVVPQQAESALRELLGESI